MSPAMPRDDVGMSAVACAWMTGSCLVQLAAYATGCIHYLSVICLLGTVTYYDVICHPYIGLSELGALTSPFRSPFARLPFMERHTILARLSSIAWEQCTEVFHSSIGFQAVMRGTEVGPSINLEADKGLDVAAYATPASHSSPFIGCPFIGFQAPSQHPLCSLPSTLAPAFASKGCRCGAGPAASLIGRHSDPFIAFHACVGYSFVALILKRGQNMLGRQ